MLRKLLPSALVLSLVIFSAFSSTGLAANSWKAISLPDTNWAHTVAAVSPSTFCVGFGKGKIYKFTNYGNSSVLALSTSESHTRDILNIKFRDSSNGFAAGADQELGGASIYRTADGGSSFSEIKRYDQANSQLWGVHSTDADHIWVCGFGLGTGKTGGAVAYTANGGASWNQVGWDLATAGPPNDIWFLDNSTGIVVCDQATGANSYFIRRTTDGGATWTTVPSPSGAGENLTAVYFVDSTTGWACGASGKILKTINGGTSWSVQTSGTTADLRDICFIDSNNGAAVGNALETGGALVRATTSGGTNWQSGNAGLAASDWLFSISGADTTNVYACGSNNVTDHGIVYKSVFDPTVTSITQVARPLATTVPQGFNGDIKITGTNFLTAPAVTCGADITVNSVTVNSATQLTVNITVTASVAAGTRNVTVTNPDTGTVTYTGFAVTAIPTITSLQYNSRHQGWSGSFQVTGTGFLTGINANFGTGINVLSSALSSSTSVTFAVQIAADALTGQRQISVFNVDGGTAQATFEVITSINPPTLTNVSFNGVPYVAPTTSYPTPEISVNPAVNFSFVAGGGASLDAFRVFVINSLGYTEISVPGSSYNSTTGLVSTTIGPLTAGDQTIMLTGTDLLGQGASAVCYVWVRNPSQADRTTVKPIIPYPDPWDPIINPTIKFQMQSEADFPGSKFIILDSSGQVLFQYPLNVVAGKNEITWNGNGGFGRQAPSGMLNTVVINGEGKIIFRGKLGIYYGR